MDPGLYRVLPERLVIRLHLDLLDPVQSHHVKIPDGFVVFRRISRGHDHPALGNGMISEGLALQELQHGRGQRLGHAVDLVDKKDALPQARLFHLFIDRGHDLAHGVLCDRLFLSPVFPLRDEGKADGALARMVGDGVGYQADAAFPCDLLHDLRLADARSSQKQYGPLPDDRDLISAVRILQKIGFHRVFDFLFRPLNIHNLSSPPLSGRFPLK